MFPYFDFKIILLVFINTVLSSDAQDYQMSLEKYHEELAQLSLSDLKNILIETKSFNKIEIEKFKPDSSGIRTKKNSTRIQAFFEKPIVLYDFASFEIESIMAEITDICNAMEKNRKKLKKMPNLKYMVDRCEFSLFKRMGKAMDFIKILFSEIEYAKKLNSKRRLQWIRSYSDETRPKLAEMVLLIRYASFLNYIQPNKNDVFALETKLDFANEIYSITVQVLKQFNEILQN